MNELVKNSYRLSYRIEYFEEELPESYFCLINGSKKVYTQININLYLASDGNVISQLTTANQQQANDNCATECVIFQ